MKILAVSLLGFLLLLLLFIIVILFVKTDVIVKAEKQSGQKIKLTLSLVLFGGLIKKNISLTKDKSKKALARMHDKVPEPEAEENIKFFEKVKKYYKSFLAFKKAYRKNSHRLYKSIYAKKIVMNVDFGMGDAASTGFLTGALWAGIYNVISFVSRIIRICEPQVQVNPDFNSEHLSLSAECIISTRLANLMFAVVSIGISYFKLIRKTNKKIKKGGD